MRMDMDGTNTPFMTLVQMALWAMKEANNQGIEICMG
jgi:hypothetical protein